MTAFSRFATALFPCGLTTAEMPHGATARWAVEQLIHMCHSETKAWPSQAAPYDLPSRAPQIHRAALGMGVSRAHGVHRGDARSKHNNQPWTYPAVSAGLPRQRS
jgi:hypothetical protein